MSNRSDHRSAEKETLRDPRACSPRRPHPACTRTAEPPHLPALRARRGDENRCVQRSAWDERAMYARRTQAHFRPPSRRTYDNTVNRRRGADPRAQRSRRAVFPECPRRTGESPRNPNRRRRGDVYAGPDQGPPSSPRNSYHPVALRSSGTCRNCRAISSSATHFLGLTRREDEVKVNFEIRLVKPPSSQLVRMIPSDQLCDEAVANCIGDVRFEVLSPIEIQLGRQIGVLRMP